MNVRRKFLLLACPIPLLLQVACGGAETAPDSMDTAKVSPELRSAGVRVGQGAQLMPQSPATGPGAVAGPGASTISSAPLDGPPRWNPQGIPAPQIEAQLARLDNAFQDESSCWTKEEPCDGDYVVELNRMSSGSVGWWSKTGRDVFVDTEDLLRLPTVPGAVTVFVKNNSASKDSLDVTLEDRSGKPAPHAAAACSGGLRRGQLDAHRRPRHGPLPAATERAHRPG